MVCLNIGRDAKCYITSAKTAPPPLYNAYNRLLTTPPPPERYIICGRPLVWLSSKGCDQIPHGTDEWLSHTDTPDPNPNSTLILTPTPTLHKPQKPAWVRCGCWTCKPQPFLANASRFNAKPSPADSHWLSRRKIYQPSPAERPVPSAAGIPLNFKLKKAVSCRKIGLKCIVVDEASNTSSLDFFHKQ